MVSAVSYLSVIRSATVKMATQVRSRAMGDMVPNQERMGQRYRHIHGGLAKNADASYQPGGAVAWSSTRSVSRMQTHRADAGPR
jgi:hypothetical protein